MPTLTCRTHSYTPCSTQDAIRLRSGVRGQLSVSPRLFTVLSSLCRDTLSIGPCSTQDVIRLHSDVLHDFPSVLFRVTFDAHCLCCGVLEETHGLCLDTTGHVHRSRLLCAGRGG
jgi:hypothetical protein